MVQGNIVRLLNEHQIVTLQIKHENCIELMNDKHLNSTKCAKNIYNSIKMANVNI